MQARLHQHKSLYPEMPQRFPAQTELTKKAGQGSKTNGMKPKKRTPLSSVQRSDPIHLQSSSLDALSAPLELSPFENELFSARADLNNIAAGLGLDSGNQ
jgi:hypothetical protein